MKEKNKNILIGILIIIIVALLILITLVVTGTINLKTTPKVNEECSQINKEENQNSNEEGKTSGDAINYDKLMNFGKSDHNIIEMEATTEYSVNLETDGRININFINYISNITNAKSIKLFNSPLNYMLYILTKDGYIYKYDLSNYESGDYNAIKVDKYSNINKMIIYKTRKNNAGGCDYIILFDNNDEYYELDSSCH